MEKNLPSLLVYLLSLLPLFVPSEPQELRLRCITTPQVPVTWFTYPPAGDVAHDGILCCVALALALHRAYMYGSLPLWIVHTSISTVVGEHAQEL